ncbi:MAG: hypothetical protein V3S29_13900, partial [bacterium]
LEVLKQLRLEKTMDLQILFVSGSTIDREVEREALTLGSDIFLDNKIGIGEIALAIQDGLNKVEKR